MPNLMKLKEAWQKLMQVMREYGSFGAMDSEPLYVASVLLERSIAGHPFVPLPASGWELYSASMDCTEAATKINEAAAELAKVANEMSDSLSARQWVLGMIGEYESDFSDEEDAKREREWARWAARGK